MLHDTSLTSFLDKKPNIVLFFTRMIIRNGVTPATLCQSTVNVENSAINAHCTLELWKPQTNIDHTPLH